jgi:hypothetical protein
MTENHLITPPPELVEQWYQDGPENDELGLVEYVATKAARWGGDQELLACGKYLEQRAAWEEEDVTEMYNYRRPKPLSLKEQALDTLNLMLMFLPPGDQREQGETIRRALEQLDD